MMTITNSWDGALRSSSVANRTQRKRVYGVVILYGSHMQPATARHFGSKFVITSKEIVKYCITT